MKEYTASPLLALAAAIILLGGSVAPSYGGAASKSAPKDEAEVILRALLEDAPHLGPAHQRLELLEQLRRR